MTCWVTLVQSRASPGRWNLPECFRINLKKSSFSWELRWSVHNNCVIKSTRSSTISFREELLICKISENLTEKLPQWPEANWISQESIAPQDMFEPRHSWVLRGFPSASLRKLQDFLKSIGSQDSLKKSTRRSSAASATSVKDTNSTISIVLNSCKDKEGISSSHACSLVLKVNMSFRQHLRW